MFFFWKNVVLAQHEFSIYGGGGISTLNYSTTVGKQNNSTGYNFGFNYGYQPVTSNWSALTGIGFSMHNSSFNLNISDFYTNTYVYDIDEEVDFLFSSYLNGHKEDQNKIFLNVPFMAKYVFDMKKSSLSKHFFYTAGGVKVGIPLGGRYHIKIDNIRNTGYYEKEDYEYTTQTFRGFGTFNNKTFNGRLDFDVALFLSFEVGMKFLTTKTYIHHTERLTIYTGLFLDYGLNNIHKTKGTHSIIEYNTVDQQNFIMNSVLNSQYMPDKSFTSIVKPIAAGIKITLSLEKIPSHTTFY